MATEHGGRRRKRRRGIAAIEHHGISVVLIDSLLLLSNVGCDGGHP